MPALPPTIHQPELMERDVTNDENNWSSSLPSSKEFKIAHLLRLRERVTNSVLHLACVTEPENQSNFCRCDEVQRFRLGWQGMLDLNDGFSGQATHSSENPSCHPAGGAVSAEDVSLVYPFRWESVIDAARWSDEEEDAEVSCNVHTSGSTISAADDTVKKISPTLSEVMCVRDFESGMTQFMLAEGLTQLQNVDEDVAMEKHIRGRSPIRRTSLMTDDVEPYYSEDHRRNDDRLLLSNGLQQDIQLEFPDHLCENIEPHELPSIAEGKMEEGPVILKDSNVCSSQDAATGADSDRRLAITSNSHNAEVTLQQVTPIVVDDDDDEVNVDGTIGISKAPVLSASSAGMVRTRVPSATGLKISSVLHGTSSKQKKGNSSALSTRMPPKLRVIGMTAAAKPSLHQLKQSRTPSITDFLDSSHAAADSRPQLLKANSNAHQLLGVASETRASLNGSKNKCFPTTVSAGSSISSHPTPMLPMETKAIVLAHSSLDRDGLRTLKLFSR